MLSAATLLLFLATGADAHGVLTKPRARNWIAAQAGREYCPHCLNGGTVGTVAANTPGDGRWPTVETVATSARHGLCGDPADASPQPYALMPADTGPLPRYGPATGGIVDVEVVVTAHHAGHMEFRVCDTSTVAGGGDSGGDGGAGRGAVTQACFDAHGPLARVPGDSAVSPIDPQHPYRFFLEPRCAKDEGATVAGIGGHVMRARVRLPEALVARGCAHCVLQMWWVSGNSCNPPGYRDAAARGVFPARYDACAGDGGVQGFWNPQLSDCGGPGGAYPARQDSAEHFSRLKVQRCTAVDSILIPANCSANP